MATQSMLQKDCILTTGRLRYWEGGPTQAPVVLLLHSGFSDAAFSWSPIWEDLAATYRVIAPDMPGFGASQAPGDMSLATLAGALREPSAGQSGFGAGHARRQHMLLFERDLTSVIRLFPKASLPKGWPARSGASRRPARASSELCEKIHALISMMIRT